MSHEFNTQQKYPSVMQGKEIFSNEGRQKEPTISKLALEEQRKEILKTVKKYYIAHTFRKERKPVECVRYG